MSTALQIARPENYVPQDSPAIPPKPRSRVIELDILRGFLLLWMALTHLPTQASIVANQTFGFVSGAEGFIFLAAFMIGQIEHRVEQKRGERGTIRDVARRTFRVYAYHCGLLAFAFTLVAAIGVEYHRLALTNLLSFYLQSPKHAVIAAALLEYRPSLFDILPLYIVFLALTPIARKVARRWGWRVVIFVSVSVWAAAQFGLRSWIYHHVNLFGLSVPETSTGAFDLYAWQLLWMVGLALGTIYADAIAGITTLHNPKPGIIVSRWLLATSIGVAAVFFVLRYCPADHWMNPVVYGWLIDKWRLGIVRIFDFAAITIILIRFGTRIASFRLFKPLAMLGQASIEVFSVHVLCCIAGHSLNTDADPLLPWWQQTILLLVTVAVLFLTAKAFRKTGRKKTAEAKPAGHVYANQA